VSTGESIVLDVKDLTPGSSIEIEIMCDICGVKFTTSNKVYKRYNNILPINDPYQKCKKCKAKNTCLERYGVDNPNKSNEIREKTKLTCLERYGAESPLKSDEVQDKIKKTNLERWGVEHPSNNKVVKNKISESNKKNWKINGIEILDKIKKTNLERWGVEIISKSDKIQDKIKKTNLERWGFEHVFSSKEVQDKIKKTNLERWGFEHNSKSFEIKEKKKKTFQEKWGVNSYSQTEDFKNKKRINDIENAKKIYEKYNCKIIDYKDHIYKVESLKCGHIFETSTSLFYQRTSKNYECCTICLPVSKMDSIGENMIYDFLVNKGIKVIKNNRNIIPPREIDLYLPDYKIGIEFNGLYWHSELFKDNKYHFNKNLECISKGIKMINIWEDEWIYKRDIVESILLNIVGLIDNKIGARSCTISLVNNKVSRDFYNSNHIQGYVSSKYNIGLFYKNELVSLMSFTSRSINGKEEFELTRFCNKKFYIINGSASKLFRYFIENFKIDKIHTYSDNSIFTGNVYNKLGFKEMEKSTINYCWFKGDRRYHRFNFNKKKLVSEGYDSSKTEVQIMNERGFYRIFGSGHKKWIWSRN
jgi:hypothetical protein